MSDKPDIAAVLRYYGADNVPEGLRNRPMLCCFHDERRPSATVNTSEGRFRCFVCGVSGDAFDVVQWKEALPDFPSTVEFIETVIGIGVEGISRSSEKPIRRRPVFGGTGDNVADRATVPTRVRRKPRPWT